MNAFDEVEQAAERAEQAATGRRQHVEDAGERAQASARRHATEVRRWTPTRR
jgi:hypothetical protein